MPRRLIKAALLSRSVVTRPPRRDVVVLMYHSVSGQLDMELDIPFDRFQQQMKLLAQTERVISLDEAVDRLHREDVPDAPYFVLTFDDAYRDFYTHAYPVLTELNLPATLYVPTGFLDDAGTSTVTGVSSADDHPPPCTWDMLRELNESPLITLGSHTHDHPELTSLSQEEIIEELEVAISRFEEELDMYPAHFAYPRGKWNPEIEQLACQYHDTLAVIEGYPIAAKDFNPHRLTRISIGRSDTPGWFRHKLRGRLDGEEAVKALVRRRFDRLSDWTAYRTETSGATPVI